MYVKYSSVNLSKRLTTDLIYFVNTPCPVSVSYTHLDVYKRQRDLNDPTAGRRGRVLEEQTSSKTWVHLASDGTTQ